MWHTKAPTKTFLQLYSFRLSLSASYMCIGSLGSSAKKNDRLSCRLTTNPETCMKESELTWHLCVLCNMTTKHGKKTSRIQFPTFDNDEHFSRKFKITVFLARKRRLSLCGWLESVDPFSLGHFFSALPLGTECRAKTSEQRCLYLWLESSITSKSSRSKQKL